MLCHANRCVRETSSRELEKGLASNSWSFWDLREGRRRDTSTSRAVMRSAGLET